MLLNDILEPFAPLAAEDVEQIPTAELTKDRLRPLPLGPVQTKVMRVLQDSPKKDFSFRDLQAAISTSKKNPIRYETVIAAAKGLKGRDLVNINKSVGSKEKYRVSLNS